MTYSRLDAWLNTFKSDEEFHRWLAEAELIPSAKICVCGSDMRIEKNRQTYTWRCCKRKDCGKSVGYFDNSFFAGTHLSAMEVCVLFPGLN